MRTILLLRGTPGSGKSTLIKNNDLEEFTVCPDTIRLMFQSPCIDEESGRPYITGKNDKRVWQFVYDRVEERMQRGEFIVIDAMNIDPSNWKKLADRYRYNVFIYNMPGNLETFLNWNEDRRVYKRVPQDVIRKAYQKLQDTKMPKWCTVIDDIPSFLWMSEKNFDEYSKVVCFGDIHGCMEPVNEYFKFHPFDENSCYLFLGDYLDRGLQNKEVLEYLLNLSENHKNVIFLEGNHAWERYWANDESEKIKSKEFLLNTLPQIQSVDKARVRNFCRRWRQMAYFSYYGKTYFATHAGFSKMPYSLLKTPACDMTRGGKYETDVDKNWNNYLENHSVYEKIIQIHGHRNLYQYDTMQFSYSYNLNDYVEFGSPLRVVEITPNGTFDYKFKNTTFTDKPNPWLVNHDDGHTEYKQQPKGKLTDEQKFLVSLRQSKDIMEKDLGNNVSSFNFKRDVFFSGRWTELNQVARGLFLNNVSGKVIARSYPKFFNYCEKDKNTDEFLKGNLRFPVTAYRKYNGFLGILSVNDGELFFASKSTNAGDFAGYFKQIFNDTVTEENRNCIKEYLEKNDCSMVFEVIDPVNDPHIIEYDNAHIVLLDIISNDSEYKKESYNLLCSAANQFGLEVKQIEFLAYNFDKLKESFTAKFENDEPIEGYVVEDDNGYMFKYKTDFYLRWKKRRSIKERYSNGLEVKISAMTYEDSQFAQWMMNHNVPSECKNKSIITLRKEYLKYEKELWYGQTTM